MLRYIALLGVLAGLVFYGCAQTTIVDKMYEVGNKSSVRVLSMADEPHGSGFLAMGRSGNIYVITNEHVCYGSNTFRVVFPALMKASLILSPFKQDKEHDLCAFSLTREQQEGLEPLDLAEHQKLHERIFIIGYPSSHPLIVSEGYTLEYATLNIADPRPERCTDPILTIFGGFCLTQQILIETSATTFGGNSGSMAVNSDGELVGVLNSGDNYTNYGSIVPLSFVKQFLRSL